MHDERMRSRMTTRAPARDLAYAAATLASEAVRVLESLAPRAASTASARRTDEQAREIAARCLKGGDEEAMLRDAAWALVVASVSLSNIRDATLEVREHVPLAAGE